MREVLGLKEARMVGHGNQAIADPINAIEEIPGSSTARAFRGILGSGDRAQGQRPALALIASRGARGVTLIGTLAGVGQLQLRRKTIGTRSDRERIAQAILAAVAAGLKQVRF